MDASFLLTGYNNESLSLVNSPPDTSNMMMSLIDKFVDVSQCEYGDNEGAPIGLQGSSLLAQLPWLTPWADLFKPIEPLKVF